MKKLRFICYTILMLLTFSVPTLAAPEIKSDCAVVIDMDTGQILFEKNAYTVNYFDNMTKLLNISTAIHNGNLNDKLEVTEESLLETDRDSLAGKLGLAVGDKITLKDALYAEILLNANDAARVVAGNLGNAEGEDLVGDSDDVKNYVSMMKTEAKYLSTCQMMVSNVMGLNSSDQISTTMDLANLMYYGFKETPFRRILTENSYDAKIYATKTVTTTVDDKTTSDSDSTEKSDASGTEDKNSDTEQKTNTTTTEALKDTVSLKSDHKMVNGSIPCEGVKGGFAVATESSGFHSITYARRTVDSGNDSSVQRKLGVVIMKSNTEEQMYDDIATLLDYGFEEWKNLTLSQNKLDNYLNGDVADIKTVFPEEFKCLIPVDKNKGDLVTATELDENGHRTGNITFSLEGETQPLGKATFYENTNVKTLKPWMRTLLYAGIGLVLLLLCYLLYTRILQPFFAVVKEKRMRDKKKRKNRPRVKRERGYKTAQKEKELAEKDAAYFQPENAPKRKPHSNRAYTKRKKR